jgi:hypothetical protein
MTEMTITANGTFFICSIFLPFIKRLTYFSSFCKIFLKAFIPVDIFFCSSYKSKASLAIIEKKSWRYVNGKKNEKNHGYGRSWTDWL